MRATVGGFALFDEFDGAATAAFEFSRCSFGSHAALYACSSKKGIFSSTGVSNINGNGRPVRQPRGHQQDDPAQAGRLIEVGNRCGVVSLWDLLAAS